ncbi:alanine racemase [Arenicella sp. 4NH20-0111]|uniref:alanine racemase n=1 Tax=Arenicella sp. 4NH20-0111 TaxID=3127648 RepID=UPI0033405964
MNGQRCYIELNTDAFAHNLACIRQLAPLSKVMAVIKANAYGHGMMLAARHLDDADEFAVTSTEDAQQLRQNQIDKPLTLLSPMFGESDLKWMSENTVRPVIYDYHQLNSLRSDKSFKSLDVWLKVDTGMGRLGFSMEEIQSVYNSVRQLAGIGSISLMTHLAQADQPNLTANQQQIALFQSIVSEAKNNNQTYSECSILNSAGVVAFSENAMDIIRPGVLLYGVSPQRGLSSQALGLQPVMTFKSSIISVRRMPSGSSIGYSGTYTLDQDSRIAYIACGYGDGYPRHAPNGTTVLVNGFLVPLVGRVSMDMIAVDIGELPVNVGDQAVLWGEGNPVEDVAEASGTIAYELTCKITQRVSRVVIQNT